MPLPIILAGIAAAAGIGGHIDAKETNEKAQRIATNAKFIYNNEKYLLENAKRQSEDSLQNFGSSKVNVLNTSIKQFLCAYERIKDVQLSDSTGLNELSNFMIDKEELFQLQNMTNIYESALSSGAAGVATGTLVAIAASGMLPFIASNLSIAGTMISIGEISTALSVTSSAFSIALFETPLVAIAAPVVLFTGISASIKADENLEKANTMYAQAQVAVESMKVSETLCNAISQKAQMLDKLLNDLNEMFAASAELMDKVTIRLVNEHPTGLNKKDLTREEIELFGVTRSLCGAVKSIIDTPMLDSNGNITQESKEVYDKLSLSLPEFSKKVNEIKSYKYTPKPVTKYDTPYDTLEAITRYETPKTVLNFIRNIFGTIVGVLSGIVIFKLTKIFLLSFSIFVLLTLLIMDNNTGFKIFKTLKNILCVAICIDVAVFLKINSKYIASDSGLALISFIGALTAFAILSVIISKSKYNLSSPIITISRLSALIMSYCIASIVIWILGHLSIILAVIIGIIIFIPVSIFSILIYEIVGSKEFY